MGYLGFGLQRWIYTQKPRKFFSKDRKPIHSEIEMFQIKSFTPAFSTSPSSSGEKTNQTQRIKANKSIQRLAIMIGFVLLITVTVLAVKAFSFTDYSEEIKLDKMREKKRYESNAYRVMTITGRKAFEKGNYVFAYEEFNRAHKLYPHAVYHQVYLANMYKQLCEEEGFYCNETAAYIQQLKEKYAGHQFLDRLND